MIVRAAWVLGALVLLLAELAHAAFIYTTLDEPAAVYNTFLAGMSGNVIVGSYRDATAHWKGFRYDGSTWTRLSYVGSPEDLFSDTLAHAVSGNVIVGHYNYQGTLNGFRWDGSHYTIIGAGALSHATGVDGGMIVGWAVSAGYVQGFTYNGSNYTYLNHPASLRANGYGTLANGISGGIIVGVYANNVGTGAHGFTYNGSTWTTFDDPVVTNASIYPTGISGNRIVGFYQDAANKYHGFLYDGSTYTTIDAPLGASGTKLYGISGTTMLGSYYDSAGFEHGLIVTVPEPSAGALAVGGALVVFRRSRRRARTTVPSS